MNRNSDQSIVQQATNWLSELIQGGAIDSPFKPLDARQSYIKWFEWFLAINPEKKVWENPQFFNLWTAAQSQRWQETPLRIMTHTPITDYWAVELAQFSVPWGHVGWINSIEQTVNDVDGGYWPTNVAYWGSPVFVDPEVNSLRWYFKLTAFNGVLPPFYQRTDTIPIPSEQLPGEPYMPLAMLDALWYPAHNKKHLQLIVPGGFVLRAYLYTPPTSNWRWQVGLKISGNTQSVFQNAAVINAREVP